MAIVNARTESVQKMLQTVGADACLVSTNVNLYYCVEKIYTGYLYIPASGEPVNLVKAGKMDGKTFYIRKPEQLPEILAEIGYPAPKNILLELGETSYLEIERLKSILNPETCGDATAFFRKLRTYKTPDEILQIRKSCERHTAAYKDIPQTYKAGMSDLEFQFAMEYVMRKHGSLGVFRTFGSNMEIFAGSILAGKNAETDSPFDFALGGEGVHASLPIGANGTKLVEGMSLMVDMGGCFTPYLSDVTRTFSIGKLNDTAYKAHQVSIEMHDYFRNDVKTGTPCAEVYNNCLKMAEKNNLSQYFMGTKRQAKFVGHGVGLQINELPVLTSRSGEIIEENMVIAFEPKFVIPNVGAVGIENTYLVKSSQIENLSIVEEEIIDILD